MLAHAGARGTGRFLQVNVLLLPWRDWIPSFLFAVQPGSFGPRAVGTKWAQLPRGVAVGFP
jgi:hypothetical protein